MSAKVYMAQYPNYSDKPITMAEAFVRPDHDSDTAWATKLRKRCSAEFMIVGSVPKDMVRVAFAADKAVQNTHGPKQVLGKAVDPHIATRMNTFNGAFCCAKVTMYMASRWPRI
jgi:hypothetical protein